MLLQYETLLPHLKAYQTDLLEPELKTESVIKDSDACSKSVYLTGLTSSFSSLQSLSECFSESLSEDE